MLRKAQKAANSRHVAKNLGFEEYQRFLFFVASKAVPFLGDINPRVSTEMRRISTGRSIATKV
jgi:hypothetical protein